MSTVDVVLAAVAGSSLVFVLAMSFLTFRTLRSTYRTMTRTALVQARTWERLGNPDRAAEQRETAKAHARRAIGLRPGRSAKVATLLEQAGTDL